MERKKLILAIIRFVRLILLVIVLALIASGAGGIDVYSGPTTHGPVKNQLLYSSYPISTWTSTPNLPGQYFPFVTSLLVFFITAIYFAILFSTKNLQSQYKTPIFYVNIISAVLLFIAACVEAWYAAGGNVSYRVVFYNRQVGYHTILRVNAWIAAVAFLVLTVVDLAVDAVFTRKD